MHDPVGAGDEQLGRHGDRLGVGDDALRRLVEGEQDVHRDRPRDLRVAVVGRLARRIVGQELRLDVAVDEEIAAQRAQQAQTGAGEGDVELDLERRRGEHQAAHARRVVVGPGADQHGTDALRQHRHVALGHAPGVADVFDEGLHVAYRLPKARRIAARPRRVAVAAGIPGVEVEIGQVEFVDQVGHAPAVFVAAVEEDDGAASLRRDGGPAPVEEVGTVAAGEVVVFGDSGHGVMAAMPLGMRLAELQCRHGDSPGRASELTELCWARGLYAKGMTGLRQFAGLTGHRLVLQGDLGAEPAVLLDGGSGCRPA